IEMVEPFTRRPIDLNGLIEWLKACVRLQELEDRATAEAGGRARAIGAPFSGWTTDLDWVDRAIDWTHATVAMLRHPLPPTLITQLLHPNLPGVYAAEECAVAKAVERFQVSSAAATERFPESETPWGSWDNAPLESVRLWCDDLHANAEDASDWLDYRLSANEVDSAVGVKVAGALRGVTDDGALVRDVVLRHVYMSWLEHLYHSVRELQFSPKDLELTRREFLELDARLPRAARERVRARCLAAHPSSAPNSHGMGELGTLYHQLSLKKRQMPVRKLVARIPNVLQRLKPCFMMSPLAVSQYLPRGSTDSETLTFDTVVFDEASQVFPEDAVPAVARGRQCIVVGDQQQLPPSNFFRRGDGDDDTTDEDDDETTEDRLTGVESILDVLVGMRSAGVDDVYLQVHYRSQHDDLIRYSNHYFYDDRLLTFPSALGARAGLGLRSMYVPEGRFEAGGSRTNRVEAEHVVSVVFELMETRPPTESIGVVALSRAQADLIEELINLRRLSDRRFDERFADTAHERFFVKNLENVQGDERDHVILSIGYGPTTGSAAVPNRFGPLNVEGGHRRLNVAVSRAKRSMTVVHSLRPEDIRSDAPGAQLLRRYLEFLRLGEASIEGAVTASSGGEAESPFEEAVGRALETRGYRIRRQVGCAKYFIDIAVMSEEGNDFDLGIECDGAAYHRSPSARDRDRLRQEILERMGWRGRIHRVWSTAWIRNPRAELDAIERAVRAARSLSRDAPRVAAISNPESMMPPATRRVNPVAEAPVRAMEAPEQPALRAYVEADLRSFPRSKDLREETPARIAALVAGVVAAECPIHIDLVVERVRRHYRLQRAGRIVRDAVLAGTKEALRQGSIRWLLLLGASGSRSEFLISSTGRAIEPRGPYADGTARHLDHVCDQEIDAALIQVVCAMVGASRADAIVATARSLGYARTGEHVERRLLGALERLVAAGSLVERLGSLVLAT
ncbi:MAG: DUF3320 domain-containing protein, partial [Acidimicrobiales bacterium]|nr:DUF3320 domain-containing protein [Acidimicrobiales bacterium]